MPVALDSNILVYFAGVVPTRGDEAKADRVRLIYDALRRTATVVTPVQAPGEVFTVTCRNGFKPEQAKATVDKFATACETPASDLNACVAAMALIADHRLQYRDALIVTVAARAARCCCRRICSTGSRPAA